MTGEKMVERNPSGPRTWGSRSSTPRSPSTTTACLKAVCPRVQGMQRASLANIVHWSRTVGFATCCGPLETLRSRWLKAGSRRLLRPVRRVPRTSSPTFDRVHRVVPHLLRSTTLHGSFAGSHGGRLRGQQRHGCPYRQSKQRRLFGHHELILKVENGEIIGSLKQAGLSGNLAKALNGAVHLGADVRRQGSYSSGSMHLPDVLLMDGLRVNPA